MPKVSVIIPVYNTEPWLRRCLDSVCGQTLRRCAGSQHGNGPRVESI